MAIFTHGKRKNTCMRDSWLGAPLPHALPTTSTGNSVLCVVTCIQVRMYAHTYLQELLCTQASLSSHHIIHVSSFPPVAFTAVFRVFDQDVDGFINGQEWIRGLSVFIRGTRSEQVSCELIYDCPCTHACVRVCDVAMYLGIGFPDCVRFYLFILFIFCNVKWGLCRVQISVANILS